MRYCDLHCDLLYKLTDLAEWSSSAGNTTFQITPDSLRGGVFLQTFAVFAPNERANEALFWEKRRLFEEIKKSLAPFGVRAVLSVENGAFLEGKVENVVRFARAGMKMLTLTWNGGNALGGAHGQERGLTGFGREVVEALAGNGVLPDVSHLSDRGFIDLAAMMRRRHCPFVASHSNARALCAHSRNLTDGQIRAVAESGGVVGVNFYPPFLGAYSPAAHIARVLSVGGEDATAIGSDFDGIDAGYYSSCEQVSARLEGELRRAGLTSRQMEKVCRINALRLLGQDA